MNKKAKELSEWYAKLAENDNGFALKGGDIGCFGPRLDANLEFYTINPPKPVKKIIDLSVCIESGIDMEFNNRTGYGNTIGYLNCIDEHGFFNDYSDSYYKECRVRKNHWHSWQGGACPMPAGLDCEYLFRDSTKAKGYSDSGHNKLTWCHSDFGSDIIAFKVTGIDDGYRYEWMEE